MNNDLISRSKLLKLFENLKKKSVNLRDVIYLEGVMAVIETAPTADTERRGEWSKTKESTCRRIALNAARKWEIVKNEKI